MSAERFGRRKFLQGLAGGLGLAAVATVTQPGHAEGASPHTAEVDNDKQPTESTPDLDAGPSAPEAEASTKKEISEQHTLTKLQELFPDRDQDKMQRMSDNFEGVYQIMQQELNEKIKFPEDEDMKDYPNHIQAYWKKLKDAREDDPNAQMPLTDPWNDALIDAHPALSSFDHSPMKEQMRTLFVALAPDALLNHDADPKWGQSLARVLHGAILGINHPETNEFLKAGKRPPKLEKEKGAKWFRNHELEQSHYTRALFQGILLASEYYESNENVTVTYQSSPDRDITSIGGTLINHALNQDLSIKPDDQTGLGKFNIEATNGIIGATNQEAQKFKDSFHIEVTD